MINMIYVYFAMTGKKTHRVVYEKFKDGTVRDISDDILFEIPTSWRWVRLFF